MRAPIRVHVIDGAQRFAALVCLGAMYQSAITNFDWPWIALALVAALGVATAPSQWDDTSPIPRPLPWPSFAQWLGMAPAWLLIALTAASVALGVSPRVTIWIFVAGAVWLLASTWLVSRDHRNPGRAGADAWILGLLVVGFAAAIRIWAIDTVPRYVHCDEGTLTTFGRAFFDNPDRNWFAPPPDSGAYAQHMVLFYGVQAAGTLLFGNNLTGARATDVLLGILSIAAFFDGLRRVTNTRVAAVAALLLAANHCHLAYSRIATAYIQTAFIVSCVFMLLARLWTAPTYFNAALLGLVAAIGLHSYQGTVVVVPMLLAIVVLLFLLHPARRRSLAVPVVVCVLTLTATSSIYGVALWQNREAMLARAGELSILGDQMLPGLKATEYHTDSTTMVVVQQLWLALRGFHAGRDHQPQYGVYGPMADPYTAALMVPGMLFALLAPRKFVVPSIVVFGVGYLVLGLGLQWAPGFNRTTGALPLAMVPAAIAIVQCAGTLWGGRRRLGRAARDVTLLAGVALCVASNLQIYFVDYGLSRLFGDADSEAGWVAREYAGRYTPHLVNWPLYGHEGLRLIVVDLAIPWHDEREDTVRYVTTTPVTGSDLFVLLEQDTAARDALLARFPQARVEQWVRHPLWGPKLWLVFVGEPRPPLSVR